MNALEGKAALVTGAAGGIGSGVVRAFAAAVARVLAVDRVDAQGEETYVGDLTRADEAEAEWTIITPILDAWRDSPPPAMPNYEAGTWGPQAAVDLIERDGRSWRKV